MTWVLASDIAERIRDLRRVLSGEPDRVVPQEELGKRAGVRPSQVSQWERGAQKPSRSRLERWAEREGWPVTIFAEGSPMPSDVLTPSASRDHETANAVSGGEPAAAERTPEHILTRFYQVMAASAKQGSPLPPELATLMHGMYRLARGSGSPGPDRSGAEPATRVDELTAQRAVPGW